MNSKSLAFCFYILFNQCVLYSQSKDVFIEDSLTGTVELSVYDTKFNLFEYKSDTITGFIRVYGTKSKQKNLENYLATEGQYVNGKKVGLFTYYAPKIVKTDKSHLIKMLSVRYKNDTLHGRFIQHHGESFKVMEGRYKYGKKDGFFISYYLDENAGHVKKVAYFNNDSLQHWSTYFIDGALRSKGFGEDFELQGTYSKFNPNGDKYQEAEFKDGVVKTVRLFDENGFIEVEKSGIFYPVSPLPGMDNSYDVVGFAKQELKSGTITEYENGTIKRKVEIVDGEEFNH